MPGKQMAIDVVGAGVISSEEAKEKKRKRRKSRF